MTHLLLIAVVLAGGPSGPSSGETSVRLNVRPMPAPKPALKYELLPELGELKPGNAAQAYLKCFMERRPFFYGKQGVAERARYRGMPLVELRLERLNEYGSSALKQADWAARLDTIDWQALERVQDGGMEAVPAEVGPLQVLAESLQVRFRAEVAAQRFDDAIRTARTMFAVGRHLGEHPTAVADLVGMWAVHLGLDTLEEMVQQPTCPNLYWALTDLPCPLVDLRKGVQGDRILVATLLRPIRDDSPMSAEEIESLVGRISVRHELRTRAGGRAAPQPASPAASQSQGRSDRRRSPPQPGRGRPYAGPRQQALAGSGHSAGGEERLRDPAGRSDQAAGLAHLGARHPGRRRGSSVG